MRNAQGADIYGLKTKNVQIIRFIGAGVLFRDASKVSVSSCLRQNYNTKNFTDQRV